MEINKEKCIATTYWDTKGSIASWYIEIKDYDGNTIVDSVKLWFPVVVNDFGLHEERLLKKEVQYYFPNVVWR